MFSFVTREVVVESFSSAKKSFKNSNLPRFFLIGVLLILCTACSDRVKPDHVDHNRTLRIGTIHQVKSANLFYDPYLELFTMISHPPLLRLQPGGEIAGLLAKSYGFSENYTTWTFALADNYFWSDGRPVTGADVKFSVEYAGRFIPNRRWIQKTLQKAEIPPGNPDEVKFTFSKPYTRLDIEFTSFRIFPQHIWKNVTRPQYFDFLSRPAADVFTGCGPFVIESVDLNAGLLMMSKNPHWQGKQPAINRIEIHMFRSLDMLSLALEKGHVDVYYKYAGSYPYTHIERLKKTGRFGFIENGGSGLAFLGFNLRNETLVNPAFRHAVSFALDYEEMVKLIAPGYGEVPNRGFVTPDLNYFMDTPKLRRDLAKAKSILKAAGYIDSDGSGIVEDSSGRDIELLLLSTPQYVRLCRLTADYLGRVGIAVRIKIVDTAAWTALKDEYRYDITITHTSPWGMRMHADWASGYFDVRRSGEGVLHVIDNPFFLSLCDQILSTKDKKNLARYAGQIQQYYAQELPAVALLWRRAVIPYHKKFSGWYSEPVFGIYNIHNFLNLRIGSQSLNMSEKIPSLPQSHSERVGEK